MDISISYIIHVIFFQYLFCKHLLSKSSDKIIFAVIYYHIHKSNLGINTNIHTLSLDIHIICAHTQALVRANTHTSVPTPTPILIHISLQTDINIAYLLVFSLQSVMVVSGFKFAFSWLQIHRFSLFNPIIIKFRLLICDSVILSS